MNEWYQPDVLMKCLLWSLLVSCGIILTLDLLIGTSSVYLSVCNAHHRASLNCSTDLNFVVKYTTWPSPPRTTIVGWYILCSQFSITVPQTSLTYCDGRERRDAEAFQVAMATKVRSSISDTFRRRLATISMHPKARLQDSTGRKSFVQAFVRDVAFCLICLATQCVRTIATHFLQFNTDECVALVLAWWEADYESWWICVCVCF